MRWSDMSSSQKLGYLKERVTLHSYGVIAEDLSTSRSAVAGFVARYRDVLGYALDRKKTTLNSIDRVIANNKEKVIEMTVGTQYKSRSNRPYEGSFNGSGSVTLLDLENHHCRFPYRDGTYCGQDKVRESYCEKHASICYATNKGR